MDKTIGCGNTMHPYIDTAGTYWISELQLEDGTSATSYAYEEGSVTAVNAENGTKLNTVVKVHYEPLGIYAGTASSLDALSDGAIVTIPNDPTNGARALLLLEANGLITLKEGVGVNATVKDITANPKNLDIREMEAALIPGVLSEAAIGVINGNYAIGAGLKVADSLAQEEADSEAAQTYANILVVKEGHENDEKIKALADALLTDTIREYINNSYEGAVVPIF